MEQLGVVVAPLGAATVGFPQPPGDRSVQVSLQLFPESPSLHALNPFSRFLCAAASSAKRVWPRLPLKTEVERRRNAQISTGAGPVTCSGA